MPNLDFEPSSGRCLESVTLDRDRWVHSMLWWRRLRASSSETIYCGTSSIVGRSALFQSTLSYGFYGNRNTFLLQTSYT